MHNRVRTCAELFSGTRNREQPITAWRSIARRNRDVMPSSAFHHPSVAPRQPLLGHLSALVENLGNLVIRVTLCQIPNQRHHTRIQSMRIAQGRASYLQRRDTAGLPTDVYA